jgi:hypothetical protein
MIIAAHPASHLPKKLPDTSFLVNGYQATLHYRTAGSIPLDIYYSDSLKIKIPDEYIFNEDMAFFNMNRLLLKVDFYPLKRKGKFDFSGNLLSAVNIIPMPADSVVFSLPAGFTLIDLPGESPKADAAAKKKLPLKSKNNSSLKNKKKPAPVKSPSAGKTN